MSVDNKEFLGYARVKSNIRHVRDVPALSSLLGTHGESEDPGFAFQIEWFSKNRVPFDYIRFIRNSHNSNNSINMCKEFNEVDEFAARLLLEILRDPESAPEPALNPFAPVGVLENWPGNSFLDNIQEAGEEPNRETFMEEGAGLGLRDISSNIGDDGLFSYLKSMVGVGNDELPRKQIPHDLNKVLLDHIHKNMSELIYNTRIPTK